jgi:hypothetical protein
LTLTGEGYAGLDAIAFIGFALFVLIVAAFAAGLSSPALARGLGDLAARIA